MATEFDVKPHARMWRDFTKLLMCAVGAMVVSLLLLALALLT